MGKHQSLEFYPLCIAVLTVTDTRSYENDTSGDLLANSLQQAGHLLADRELIPDDVYLIRKHISHWIADREVHAILITGGTGFTQRDSTPEAVIPLLDKTVEGFGELFRQISFQEIGTSTIQSRAFAGIANKTFICGLPGSTNACDTAWNKILLEQLDARQGPCNFVSHLK